MMDEQPDANAVWTCISRDASNASATIYAGSHYEMWLRCQADGPMVCIPAEDALRLADMIREQFVVKECFDLREIAR